MGAVVPVIILTIFWGLIGGVAPFVVPKGPNKGLIQMMLIMTAVCCYMFWLCTFLMQLNPLIGPQLSNETLRMMKWYW